MQRRTFIAGAGVTLTSLGGCIQAVPKLSADERTPSDNETNSEKDLDRNVDVADDLSINGRVHNGTDDPRTFDIRILEAGDFVFGCDIAVEDGSTTRVPAWGAPGERRTFEITVDGTTVVESFEFDVGPSSNLVDGYVDVVYYEDEGLDVSFTPVNNDGGGDPASAPVLRRHAVSDHAITPEVERRSDLDSWGLFLATRETAETYFGGMDESGSDDDVRAFIDASDFENGDRLLYIHAYAPQTCYELALDGDPYVADNGEPHVATTVHRTAPEDVPCGDAVTPVRLLLRLSFSPVASIPDAVAVRVAGHQDEADTLLVDSEP